MSLIVESQSGIVTLSLNRPERRNALTLAMLEELCAALEAIKADQSTRVVILKGAGKDFSSGFDLIEGQDLKTSLKHGELLCRAQLLLAETDQITVAAVSGYALAGGGALIAACDYAVASKDAKFGYPVLKVGIVPTPGMPFLRHELSDRDFRTLVLSGELWDGQRAMQAGLVNKVVATAEAAVEEAHRFASLILESSPSAVAVTKSFANELTRGNLRDEMETALLYYKEVRKGPEATEGLEAFAEKRKPDWNR
jgi:methylglutaconyl-CoA hydratase